MRKALLGSALLAALISLGTMASTTAASADQRDPHLPTLFKFLKSAQHSDQAGPVEDKIWEIWSAKMPSPRIREPNRGSFSLPPRIARMRPRILSSFRESFVPAIAGKLARPSAAAATLRCRPNRRQRILPPPEPPAFHDH